MLPAVWVAAVVAVFALLLVIWAACVAVSQHLEDRRLARTGDFLLEAKR